MPSGMPPGMPPSSHTSCLDTPGSPTSNTSFLASSSADDNDGTAEVDAASLEGGGKGGLACRRDRVWWVVVEAGKSGEELGRLEGRRMSMEHQMCVHQMRVEEKEVLERGREGKGGGGKQNTKKGQGTKEKGAPGAQKDC